MSKLEDEPGDDQGDEGCDQGDGRREQGDGRREANETLVRRLFEDVLSNGELDVIDELFASDHVGYVDRADGVWRGPDAVKRTLVELSAVFFEPKVTIDNLGVSENSVLVHWSATGRHEREFMELEPTCVIGEAGTEPGGRTVTASGATLCLVEDGEIRESWTTWDVASFLAQFPDQTGAVRSHLGARFPFGGTIGHDEATDLHLRRDGERTPSPLAASDARDRDQEERVDD